MFRTHVGTAGRLIIAGRLPTMYVIDAGRLIILGRLPTLHVIDAGRLITTGHLIVKSRISTTGDLSICRNLMLESDSLNHHHQYNQVTRRPAQCLIHLPATLHCCFSSSGGRSDQRIYSSHGHEHQAPNDRCLRTLEPAQPRNFARVRITVPIWCQYSPSPGARPLAYKRVYTGQERVNDSVLTHDQDGNIER
jgi:hypothetical protein